MEFLSYAISALIVFLGPFIGAVLMFIAPEEFKPGEKYFILARDVLFLIALLSVVSYYIYIKSTFVLIALIILLAVAYFTKKNRDIIEYCILSFVFYLSLALEQMFIVISAVIFIYGLPVGTLATGDNVKNRLKLFGKIFLRYFLFIVIALALFRL